MNIAFSAVQWQVIDEDGKQQRSKRGTLRYAFINPGKLRQTASVGHTLTTMMKIGVKPK